MTTTREEPKVISSEEKLTLEMNKIVNESFLKRIIRDLNNTDVTDINFDGTNIRIQTNNGIKRMDKPPTSKEVETVARKIADLQGKTLTNTQPILDTEFGIFRINAIHNEVSPDGASLSIRISKPRLVVNNIREFTWGHSLDLENLYNVLVEAEVNQVLGGRTGSGKTEFQKLLVKPIPNDKVIALIEDTRDSHIKALYPDKFIYSWRTLMDDQRSKKIDMSVLVKASLRSNPDWVIIAETRGHEAADVLDSVKTDHSIITSIHIKGAKAAPSRMIPMIRQAPHYASMSDISIGKEIVEFLNFATYLQPIVEESGKKHRVIKELFEFTGFTTDGAEGHYIYQITQDYNEETGEYRQKQIFRPLSEKMQEVLKDKKLFHKLPDIFKTPGTKILIEGEEMITVYDDVPDEEEDEEDNTPQHPFLLPPRKDGKPRQFIEVMEMDVDDETEDDENEDEVEDETEEIIEEEEEHDDTPKRPVPPPRKPLPQITPTIQIQKGQPQPPSGQALTQPQTKPPHGMVQPMRQNVSPQARPQMSPQGRPMPQARPMGTPNSTQMGTNQSLPPRRP